MIFCVEDDSNIRELVVYTLNATGMNACGFGDGQSFMEALETETPELILLDIMLPGEDGLSILRKLKSSSKTKHIPVIMVTAKGNEYDKVIGLDAGADDYVAKPFGMMELVSRIKAVLRRANEQQQGSEDNCIRQDQLVIDIKSYTVTLRGEAVICTPKEIEILYMLASNPGQVFTREQLLNKVWGYDFAGETRTVDTHIKRIRAKLDNTGLNWSIKTIYGVGYKFEVE